MKKTKKPVGLKDGLRKRKMVGTVMRSYPGWLMILPSLLLFVLIVWRPICMAFYYSFFRLQGLEPIAFAGLQNFKDVLSDTAFRQTLFNTIQYVLWSLIIGLPIPFFAAVMINEAVHLKGYFKFVMYLPVIIPTVATCLIWKMLYLEGSGGLLNTLLAYIGVVPQIWLSNKNAVIPLIIVSMTWQGFGSNMLLYLASLQSMDQSLIEAARIDGAGLLRCFWHILLPHMRGIILLLGIKQMIGVFQITEQPMVMTGGGPNGASMSLGLTNYLYAFRYGQFDKSMALGVISFLFLLILTFVYFKLDRKFSE